MARNVIKSNGCAEMAEWSNAHDSKSCYVGTRTGVRIPLSAPYPAERLLPLGGIFFVQRMRDSRGGKQALPAQVGGFYRRQNSGHPLFSVRVRSRRESLSLRHRWTPLGVPFCVVQRELKKRRGSGFGASQALPWGSRLRDTAAYRAAPNEYNPNLKPILVGGAFGLFLFYNLIQMTPLLYYAIIAI